MKWIVKNVVKWRNNTKIKRVQPQSPPFQHENIGKKIPDVEFRVAIFGKSGRGSAVINAALEWQSAYDRRYNQIDGTKSKETSAYAIVPIKGKHRMNKHTIMTILWFVTGVLWLIAFLVLDNGAQIMALFCAFLFLFVAFYRQYKKR